MDVVYALAYPLRKATVVEIQVCVKRISFLNFFLSVSNRVAFFFWLEATVASVLGLVNMCTDLQ